MPAATSGQVHPTAIVSPDAVIGDGVRIGPYTVIDGPVTIGPGCVVGPHVHLVGPLVLGRGNQIGTGTVIGTPPLTAACRAVIWPAPAWMTWPMIT